MRQTAAPDVLMLMYLIPAFITINHSDRTIAGTILIPLSGQLQISEKPCDAMDHIAPLNGAVILAIEPECQAERLYLDAIIRPVFFAF